MSATAAPRLSTDTRPIDRVVGRARRRIRLQRALEVGTTALLPVGALGLVVVLLFKLGFVDEQALVLAAAAGAASVLLAALVAAWWRLPDVVAARAIDARADLADRLGTAQDFEHVAEPTPFMEAAIRDAARVARGLRVGRHLPLRRPKDLGAACLMLLAVALLFLLRFPMAGDGAGLVRALPPMPPPPPMVPPFQAALAQKKVEESRKEADRLKDEQAKKVLGKLDELWKGIHNRQFDKRELWRRLAALQKQAAGGKLSEEDKAELGRMKKMGDSLGKSDVTKRLSDALKKGDLDEAQRALRELARKLSDNKLTKKERKELEKALKKAAEKTQKQLTQMKRKLEKLQKQMQKRKLEKLAKNKKERQLEKLKKEMDKLASQLSTQLSQELMDALKKMKKYENPDAGRSLEKAAQRMKEMMKKIRRLQLLSKTRDHIKEMKDLLRRGNQKGRDDQMKDFFARAGDGQGDDITLKLPGEGDQEGQGDQPGGKQLKPKGGGTCQKCGGGHPTGQHGSGQGQKGDGQGKGQGPGIGTGSDHKLGAATDLKDARYRDLQLKGKKGRGEQTSEVFMGAATKGFSRVGYKKVYNRYKEAVEEALEKNKGIPPGQKRIVEKYFEMIRPR